MTNYNQSTSDYIELENINNIPEPTLSPTNRIKSDQQSLSTNSESSDCDEHSNAEAISELDSISLLSDEHTILEEQPQAPLPQSQKHSRRNRSSTIKKGYAPPIKTDSLTFSSPAPSFLSRVTSPVPSFLSRVSSKLAVYSKYTPIDQTGPSFFPSRRNTSPDSSEAPPTSSIPYIKILNVSNEVLVIGATAAASVANGLIYFSPAQSAFENVFHADAPWEIKLFSGSSAFLANTLLPFERIGSLIRFAKPVPYSKNITGPLGFVLEVPSNLMQNIFKNDLGIVTKVVGTLLCLLVVISFSLDNLSKYFKDSYQIGAADIPNLALFVFSNLVAAGIYAEGWRKIFKRLSYHYARNGFCAIKKAKNNTQLSKNDDPLFYAEYANTLFNSLSADHFRKEFILAYNEIVLEPYLNQMRKHLASWANIIADKEIFNLKEPLSFQAFKKGIESALPDELILKFIDSYNLVNIKLKFESFLGSPEKIKELEASINTGKAMSSIELITICYENQLLPSFDKFINLLLGFYMRQSRKGLEDTAKAIMKVEYKLPEYSSASPAIKRELLPTNATFNTCLMNFDHLLADEKKTLLHNIFKNNHVFEKHPLSKPSQIVSLTLTSLGSIAVMPAGYLAGKNIANMISPNNMVLAIFLELLFSTAGMIGRLGIFINSGLGLANNAVNFIQYADKQLKEDIASLKIITSNIPKRIRGEVTIQNHFITASSVAASLLYLSYKIAYHLLCVLLILPSPLGYVGVCMKGLEALMKDIHADSRLKMGWPHYTCMVTLGVFGFIGAFLVNVSSVFDFFLKTSNFLQQSIEQGIDKLFGYDKKDYWQLHGALLKVANKIISNLGNNNSISEETPDPEKSLLLADNENPMAPNFYYGSYS